ncbi:MAG: pyridoxamine 5'-phosphate oxidase family protein [Pseudomonadota bacterium]
MAPELAVPDPADSADPSGPADSADPSGPADSADDPYRISELGALERLYGAPAAAALAKEVAYLHPHYRAFIEAAPLLVLATSGPGGLDVSPRGDRAGWVALEDEQTLLLPDRRGNNRIDSLRNIVADPRVALLFLVPGVGETLRVNGRAAISVAPALLARFAVDGKAPRSVLVIKVEAVFFQCARALVRAKLWDEGSRRARAELPSAGAMLAALSAGAIDGGRYDLELPERLANSLY